MSETVASDAGSTHLTGEAPPDSAARAALQGASSADSSSTDASSTDASSTDAALGSDPEAALEIEVEEIEAEVAPPPAGCRAFLQNASLHNLLQIESLSRSSGVFEVRSQGRTGHLHLAQGELIHAELGALGGQAAALEILSWPEGELETSARPLAALATIAAPLQALMLRHAQTLDEAVESVRRPPLVRSVPLEEDRPTEPRLPAPGARAPADPDPPRPTHAPPPLAARLERDASVAEVALSPSGELLSSRGQSPDEFAARVAYAARLSELIGRAIRSGTPRALELHGKRTHTDVRWRPDGSLAATLELVQSPKLR